MFDHHPLKTETAPKISPPWASSLSRGDVVLFAFPQADENGGKPQPQPCLVLDIVERPDKRFVSLACSTSHKNGTNKGYAISVTRRDDCAAAGLDEPISFAAQSRVLVTLSHSGFPKSLPSPVLGRLRGEAFERMNAVRARLAAEADMRSAKRDERRRTDGTSPHATLARRPKLSLPAFKSTAS